MGSGAQYGSTLNYDFENVLIGQNGTPQKKSAPQKLTQNMNHINNGATDQSSLMVNGDYHQQLNKMAMNLGMS